MPEEKAVQRRLIAEWREDEATDKREVLGVLWRDAAAAISDVSFHELKTQMEKGANVNDCSMDDTGLTLLMLAAKSGSVKSMLECTCFHSYADNCCCSRALSVGAWR